MEIVSGDLGWNVSVYHKKKPQNIISSHILGAEMWLFFNPKRINLLVRIICVEWLSLLTAAALRVFYPASHTACQSWACGTSGGTTKCWLWCYQVWVWSTGAGTIWRRTRCCKKPNKTTSPSRASWLTSRLRLLPLPRTSDPVGGTKVSKREEENSQNIIYFH